VIETGSLRRTDFFLLSLLVILSLVGIVVLRGGTQGQPYLEPQAVRQTAWLCVGLIVFFAALLVDYHHWETIAIGLYSIHLVMLGYLLAAGRSVKGARSWVDLGLMNWQPSETMKIAVVVILARILASRPDPPRTVRALLLPLGVTLLPALLVLAQPDLGSATIYFAILFGLLYWAGVSRRLLISGILAAGLLAAGSYPFLKPYQKDRILIFLNPGSDPLGSGYNLVQSKIALGSGQWMGKGWGQGTQTNMEFLPEHHSDFIFASLGEQFGLLGCLAVLGIYALIAWRGLGVVALARDPVGALIAGGMMSIFLAHLAINLGMVFGFLPVTGLPLPFFSAGGSALVTNFLLFGLVVNVGMRRFVFHGG
jgi:rod shape determining protein RodA